MCLYADLFGLVNELCPQKPCADHDTVWCDTRNALRLSRLLGEHLAGANEGANSRASHITTALRF